MTERGHEPRFGHNGDTTATKGENTIRPANHIAHIATPTVTAIKT